MVVGGEGGESRTLCFCTPPAFRINKKIARAKKGKRYNFFIQFVKKSDRSRVVVRVWEPLYKNTSIDKGASFFRYIYISLV